MSLGIVLLRSGNGLLHDLLLPVKIKKIAADLGAYLVHYVRDRAALPLPFFQQTFEARVLHH
jgi:hypothetical protein